MTDQPHQRQYWFPAKRYGWGWGAPITWQGWVVMVIWIVALIAGYCLVPREWVDGHFVFLIAMTLGMIGICLWKGEQPRWRWGD